jgi:hypothetical protein
MAACVASWLLISATILRARYGFEWAVFLRLYGVCSALNNNFLRMSLLSETIASRFRNGLNHLGDTKMWAEITYTNNNNQQIQIFNGLERNVDDMIKAIETINHDNWLGVTNFRTGPYIEDEEFGSGIQQVIMGKMYGKSLSVKSIDYNEYVIGFVIEFNDGRTINVQFEINRNTNHPEPSIVAAIGIEGDETIDAFNADERDWISRCVLNIDEIKQFGRDLTEITYSGNDEAVDMIKTFPLFKSTVSGAIELINE